MSTSIKRIERLHLQGGGKNVGVIFMLQEKKDDGTRDGTIALMDLQIR
jgi:hypothetical protein